MRWHRYDVGALSELCRSFRVTPAEAVAPNQMDATASASTSAMLFPALCTSGASNLKASYAWPTKNIFCFGASRVSM